MMLVVTATLHAGVREDALLKLEIARANLRISEAAEADVAEDLSQLRDSGNATAEKLLQYETYRRRLHDIVLENRKSVARMEAAYARYAGTGGTPAVGPHDGETATESGIPIEEEMDELAGLERAFQKSLSDFDEMLLSEMEEIEKKSAEVLQKLSAAADQAAEEIGGSESGSRASGEETSTEKTADATGEKADGRGRDEEMETQGGSYETAPTDEAGYTKPPAGEEKQPGGQSTTSDTPQDDDIVARQLREAAEKETDPELKKKLWKEYEQYKKGQ